MQLHRAFYLCFFICFSLPNCKEKSEIIEKPELVKPEYLSEAWVKKKLIEVDSNPSEQKSLHRNHPN